MSTSWNTSLELAMKAEHETAHTINLDRDQLLVLDGGPNGRMRMLHGAAWLTADGEVRPANEPQAGPAARSIPPETAPSTAIDRLAVHAVLALDRAIARLTAGWAQGQTAWRRQVIRLQFGAPAVQSEACN
jgi:hypothetical protein